MICFRDTTFCARTNECGNLTCTRRFTGAEQEAAKRWWGGDGAPVAFADFSSRGCFLPSVTLAEAITDGSKPAEAAMAAEPNIPSPDKPKGTG